MGEKWPEAWTVGWIPPKARTLTPGGWRLRKRHEWLEVRRAMRRYQFGARWCPQPEVFNQILALMRQYEDGLKATWPRTVITKPDHE